MAERTDYWALMEALKEKENSGMTQAQKAESLGIAQARVSILERIRTTGTPEIMALIKAGDLPADALKYLPMSDAEIEADWARRMTAATENERKALLKELKEEVAGVAAPSHKDVHGNIHYVMREVSSDNFEHDVGLVSGIGYMQGLYGFDAARDPSGRAQFDACKKLCQGRKPGQYRLIRNFFGMVVSAGKV